MFRVLQQQTRGIRAVEPTKKQKKTTRFSLLTGDILNTTSMLSYGAEAYQEFQVGRWVEGVVRWRVYFQGLTGLRIARRRLCPGG